MTEPWIATVVLAGGLIDSRGTAGQRQALLPALAAGRLRPALAHPEAAGGDDPLAICTRAEHDGACWRLTGAKPLVIGAGDSDLLLVSARGPEGLGVFLVRPEAAGLALREVELVHGGRAADLTLDRVGPAERLGDGTDAGPALRAALDRANAAQCADAVGAMDALLEATVAHTKAREQFGQPLAAFQALRHRMAEMAVNCTEARAAALLATLSADADPTSRARGVSGARARIGPLARAVAQEAIQLHGAMGVTEELPVGDWFKRLFAFESLWGTTGDHLRRYGAALPSAEDVAEGLLRVGDPDDTALNLTMSAEDARFRDEVRAFLDTHLTEDLRRAERLNPSFLADPEVGRQWQARLHRQGWAAPSWPAEHGGPGWSLTRRYIFDQECERAGEPHFRSTGLKMLAPVLMRFGTTAQQRRHLPGILSGADLWAQGYSEPGSGSDLASLQTRAVREGDDYLVTGTKIWTTHGHHASRMFALVRTDSMGRKQQGITFLLIDMTAPGITIRPIHSICGTHEFNQVFLDGVRVPVSERVGDEGMGWTIAKYLLEFERGGAFAGGQLRALLARLRRMAEVPGGDGRRAIDDPLFAAAFVRIATRVDANDILELTALSAAEAGGNPGAVASSVMKIERSRIRQAIAELAAQALGADALRWEVRRPLHLQPPEDPLAEDRKVASAAYFNSRAQSIFGGANEIQLEIIAKALLG